MNLSYKGPWTRRTALVYSQHRHGGGSFYTVYTGFRFQPTKEEDSGDYAYSWLSVTQYGISYTQSVRMFAWNYSAPTGRIVTKMYIWAFFFQKFVEKLQDSLEKYKNNEKFTCRPINIFDHISQFFLEWRIFQTKVVDKIEIHILWSDFFFSKTVPVWDNVEKLRTAGQAPDWQYGACALPAV
jgi:hypothetical protein